MKAKFILLSLFISTPALAWESKPLSDLAVYPERAAPAQVLSPGEMRVSAETSGRIEQLPLEPGQVLAKGAVIAKLDCRDHELASERAKAALAAAQAQVKLAAAQWERVKRQAPEKAAVQDWLEVRTAELETAKAQAGVSAAALKIAEHEQTKCLVTAPFNAVVAARLIQPGELARPGSPLASLVDAARIEVKAEVREADAAGLKVARAIRFAGPQVDHPLRLVAVTAPDKTTHVAEASLRFTAKPAPAGAAGKIEWNTNEAHVPPEVVVKRNGRLGVFVAEGRNARFHVLPTAEEGKPALASGLKLDSVIVTGGWGEIR
jgi:RND family efflux transporter MFP subunit